MHSFYMNETAGGPVSTGGLMSHRAIKSIFASVPERRADEVLQRIAYGGGDRLHNQVSLAQLVDVDHPDIRAVSDKRFALAASFDFVFTRDAQPLFVVEIDGIQHSRDTQVIERDRKKDAICDVVGLPILRMSTALAMVEEERRSILEYVVDSYYLAEAFFEAQESGTIPWDEPFYRGSLVEQLPDGRTRRGLDSLAIDRLSEYEASGAIPHRIPNVLVVRERATRQVRCHAYLAVASDRFIRSNVLVRDFSFVGITPGELAEGLAIIDIARKVRRWVEDNTAEAINRVYLEKDFAYLQKMIDSGAFLSASAYTPNARVGGPITPIVLKFGRHVIEHGTQ